jgi:hypothetical protein
MPFSNTLVFAPEGRGSARLVFRYLNRGKLCSVHSLESNQVATGVDHGNVHFPIPFPGLHHRGPDCCLGAFERYGRPVRHVEGHGVRHNVKGVWCRPLFRVERTSDEQGAAKNRDGCFLVQHRLLLLKGPRNSGQIAHQPVESMVGPRDIDHLSPPPWRRANDLAYTLVRSNGNGSSDSSIPSVRSVGKNTSVF